MTKIISSTAVLAMLGLLSGCGPVGGSSQQTQPAAAPVAPATPAAPASQATATAPDVFKAHFTTAKGDFVIEVHRAWAPLGADRFYNLVKIGYFDGAPFFRVVKGFMVQFGINAAPALNAQWYDAKIADDSSAGQSNKRGMVTFAMAGPNTRTTQVFINYADNTGLDSQGFVPFGQVVSGMDIVDSLYGGYGDGAPYGQGPDQGRLQSEGAAYTKSNFPQMDYVTTAKID